MSLSSLEPKAVEPGCNLTFMLEVKRSTLEIDGDPVAVRYAGEGPLVVLCHGFPETAAVWTPHLRRLASQGFTAAAVDLRGHGDSVVPTDSDAYSTIRS